MQRRYTVLCSEWAMDMNVLRCQPGSRGTASVPPVRRRVRGDGDLRQARVRRRRRGRGPPVRAVRARGARSCSRSPLPGSVRGCRAGRRSPGGDRRDRLRGAVGAVLRRLERMDASLLALILYVYPAMVLSGRSPSAASAQRAAVARCSSRSRARARPRAGRRPAPRPARQVMGLGAALTYTVYILAGDRVGAGVPPVALAASSAWARRAPSGWPPSCAAARSSGSAPTAGHGWARSPS